MSIDRRAIATQGLGFSPRMVAVQGLYPTQATTPLGPRPRMRRKPKRHDRDDDALLFLLR